MNNERGENIKQATIVQNCFRLFSCFRRFIMKRTTWQPSSRLIGQRQREQQARKHVANLLRVRSSVDMSAPKSMTYAKGKNAKKKQKEQERKKEIDKENNRLIRKILELDPGQRIRGIKVQRGLGNEGAYRLASMVRRRKEKEKLNLQNREMLHRIHRQPTFTKKAWEAQEQPGEIEISNSTK